MVTPKKISACSCQMLLEQRAHSDIIIEQFESETSGPLHQSQELFYTMLRQSIEFRPPSGWIKNILKKVINSVESAGDSCCDEIVELLLQVNDSYRGKASISGPSSEVDSEPYFIIYSLPTGKVICRVMKLHNEVGTKVWGAGLFLSEICVNFPEVFANTSVLELGSGSFFLLVPHCSSFNQYLY